MNHWLDDDLKASKSEAPPEKLNQLELRVWAEISHLRAAPAASLLLPVRAASLVAALGLGLAGGSFAAAASAGDPDEISAFSVKARLAPSTLLDGHR